MATTIIKTSDSMTTIQKKLKNGGDIKFNPGTYNITKQLILYKNSKIELAGVKLRRKGNIQSIFLNNCSKDSTLYNADGNITLRNGTFEGMGGYSYDNMVTFFHSHDILITNCTFLDTLCHAIELNSCITANIINCRFLGFNLEAKEFAYRELIQIDQAAYSSFVLKGSTKSSKCYDGTTCDGITISNCTFDKSDWRDYPYACIGGHCQLSGGAYHKNISITNNIFHTKRNELKRPCLSIIAMRKVTISKNSFDAIKPIRIYSRTTSYKTNGDQVPAVSGDGYCKTITISDNIFQNAETPITKSNGAGKAHSGITSSNNQIIII